jgi:molybdopterin synthase sulfur carrier subunit
VTRVLYFARIRQIVGKGEEEVAIPAEIKTIDTLIHWLKGRGEEYASAFSDTRVVRAAINQSHVPLDAPLADAKEIAFFPPVTGG